jgi:hypothetical protein
MSDKTSGKAVASLVFAILALVGVCPCIGSVVAIVLGNDVDDGVARAGVVLGWIGLILSVVGILVFVALMLLGGGIAAINEGF